MFFFVVSPEISASQMVRQKEQFYNEHSPSSFKCSITLWCNRFCHCKIVVGVRFLSNTVVITYCSLFLLHLNWPLKVKTIGAHSHFLCVLRSLYGNKSCNYLTPIPIPEVLAALNKVSKNIMKFCDSKQYAVWFSCFIALLKWAWTGNSTYNVNSWRSVT